MVMILNNLVPVFALMVLGNILGRKRFIPQEFFKGSDRLVYFIFFPAMLFWKIGGSDAASSINWTLEFAILGLLTGAWILSLAYAKASGMQAYWVGAFAQCSCRFNTYVGMAVVLSAMGEVGVREFGILISVVIPWLNVLAVSTCIWYSSQSYSTHEKLILFLKALIANPLILGCLFGLAFSMTGWTFPPFFDNTFRLLSVSALPLALLAVGNALTTDVLKGYLAPALVSCVIKHVVLPVSGFFVLKALGIEGSAFKVALLFLAMPTSVSAFILSSQLGSDPRLASACIVLSTILSFFSLSAVLLI